MFFACELAIDKNRHLPLSLAELSRGRVEQFLFSIQDPVLPLTLLFRFVRKIAVWLLLISCSWWIWFCAFRSASIDICNWCCNSWHCAWNRVSIDSFSCGCCGGGRGQLMLLLTGALVCRVSIEPRSFEKIGARGHVCWLPLFFFWEFFYTQRGLLTLRNEKKKREVLSTCPGKISKNLGQLVFKLGVLGRGGGN